MTDVSTTCAEAILKSSDSFKKIKDNYSTDFIERNTYVRANDSSNNSYTTTATMPCIRGTSETIARILRPYNIRIAHKPMFTLRRLLTNVKDKDEPEERPGAVYKIKAPTARPLNKSVRPAET